MTLNTRDIAYFRAINFCLHLTEIYFYRIHPLNRINSSHKNIYYLTLMYGLKGKEKYIIHYKIRTLYYLVEILFTVIKRIVFDVN